MIIPSLYCFIGIAIYATLVHLGAGWRQPMDPKHLLFAGVTLFAIPFALTHICQFQATDIATFTSFLKWNLTFALLDYGLMVWFISCYGESRNDKFLIAFSVGLSVLIVVNLILPYSVQYAEITELRQWEMAWGESITRAVGTRHIWAYLTAGMLLVGDVLMWRLMGRWSQGWSRHLMKMMLLVYFGCTVLGILARLSLIPLLEPGAFAFIGMVGVMSMVFNRETEERLITSESRLRAFVEQSPFSVQVLNGHGRIVQVNAAWEKLWGFAAAAIANRNIFEEPSLGSRDILPEIQRGLAGEAVDLVPHLYEVTDPVTGKQKKRWILGHIYPIQDQWRKTREVIVMHRDVTPKKRIEQSINLIATGVAAAVGDRFFEQLVKSLTSLFDAHYAFIGVLDQEYPEQVNTLAVCANGEVMPNITYSLQGTPCADVLGQQCCLYTENVQTRFPEDELLVQMGVESYFGKPIVDAHGRSLGLIAVLDHRPMAHTDQFQDIMEIFAARAGAELQRLRDEMVMRQLAYEDYLTKLPNRACFHEKLTETLHHTFFSQAEGALLLIDLDHFKTINDALGHDVGDEVLRAIARRLQQVIADQAFVARLGGDEFVVIINGTIEAAADVEQRAQDLAQRIMTKLSSPIYVGDRAFTVGASIGVTLFPDDGMSELDILRRADMALYRAKSSGRNAIQFYRPSFQTDAINRLRIEAGLRQVIANDELELYFQPQVNIHGQLIGAEVLLRWHHPELGDISPAIFIPIAEETGLIHSIGFWVFEHACKCLSAWLAADIPFQGHLSVNVCPWQFARPDFVSQVQHLLSYYNIDPSYLAIEITETALLFDLQDTIDKLNLLRSLGLRIALDDFGTGYSSLAYLKNLPFDLIKIDKAFVSELEEQAEHSLVESIIAISRLMDLEVVAEGVETIAQRDILNSFGCQHFQGYLFGRPLPESEFIEWMHQHHLQIPKLSHF